MTQLLERLKFVKYQLDKLQAEERVRYEGTLVFQEARQELDDVIATFKEPDPVVAPVVMQVMTAEQVTVIVEALKADNEASDLAVIDAVTASKDELIAAIKPQA